MVATAAGKVEAVKVVDLAEAVVEARGAGKAAAKVVEDSAAAKVEEMVEGKVVVAKGVVKEVEMEIEQEPIKLMDSLFIYCT